MDMTQVSPQDDYQTITSLLEGLNAKRMVLIDGPGMLRESTWVLAQPELCLKVTQEDAGNVTVFVNNIQLLSGVRFLEIVLAGVKVKAKAAGHSGELTGTNAAWHGA